MRSQSLRGLRDIRTMSGRISEVANPQRKYLSLAMLELEKARRNQEKRSAGQRVENIERRVAEIEEEQVRLLARAEAELAEAAAAKALGPAGDPESHAEHGFRLAY